MRAQVLELLLKKIEDQRGKLVVIMAGYQSDMEELLAFNVGLQSRFLPVSALLRYARAKRNVHVVAMTQMMSS